MQLYQYMFIILWIGMIAIFVKIAPNVKRKELVCGVEQERYPWWVVLLFLIPLVIMAATRIDFSDTYNYRYAFQKLMPDDFSGLNDYLNTVSKDKGFYLFSALIRIFVTDDYTIYFAIKRI